MTLTEQIRDQLKASGLSQNQLHEEFDKAGLTLAHATIAKLISDERHPNVDADTLNKAFSLLGNPVIKFPRKQWPEKKKPGRRPKG